MKEINSSDFKIPVETNPLDGVLSFEKASDIYNQENFWYKNFFIALCPFFACGLPLHVLPSADSSPKEEIKMEEAHPFDWKTWFRFRFKTPLSSWMTIFLAPVYFVSTSYLAFLIGRIIVDWAIRGDLTLQHFFDISNILAVGPCVLTVNYIWLGAHAIAPMLRSLLEPIWVPGVVAPVKTPGRTSQGREDFQINMTTIKTELELQSFRSHMIRSYVLWILTHTIHILIVSHRWKIEKWSVETIYRHCANYISVIFYSCMLIVYSNFSGIILWKFHRLNGYIRQVMETGEKIRMRHVFYIERTYSRIAEDIMHVNFICRNTMQPVFNVLYYTMLLNTLKIVFFLLARIFSSLDFDFWRFWSRRSWESVDVGLTEDSVRVLMGMIIEALMYLYLTLNSLYDAIHANDEARYLHARINNLAAELASEDRWETVECRDDLQFCQREYIDPRLKENLVNEDVYRAIFLVKQYIHSRMEAHAGRRKALLSIFGLVDFRPAIGYRLFGYDQKN